MKKIGIIVLVMSIAVVNHTVYGQEKKSKKERQQEQTEKVRKMVEAQDYTFVAQHAIPMSGKSVSLTSGYEMYVGRDTVNVYLPYFGRAYVAPMDPTGDGIKFGSRDFEYKLNNMKKGGWNVFIKPKDIQQRYEINLRITASGSASLSVNDDRRQNISFIGYIDNRKEK